MRNFILLLFVLCFCLHLNAQFVVEGVVHHDSIPLQSVNVIIKNTKKGVATDEKGKFKLEAKKGDTLSISYLGYKTNDIVLDETKTLNVNLVEDSLDEVVVIGYATKTKCYIKGACGFFVESEKEEEKSNVIHPKLYPNPSSNGIFNLKLSEDYDEVKITVANMSGQIVKSLGYKKFGNQKQIDLSQFSTGIYIINIIADGKALDSIKAVRN